MGIGPVINTDYSVKKRLDRGAKAPNFSALTYSEKGALSSELKNYISDGTKKMVEFIKGKSSETVNISVTAFGTAIVSPLFIGFNPLAEEDEETRWYSALRQPISAVITAATTLGTTYGFNRMLDRLVSSGNMADYKAMQYAPKPSYIKYLIKKDGLNLKGEALDKEVKRRTMQIFEDSVENYKKELGNKSIDYLDLVDPDEYKEALKTVKKDERFMESISALSKKERNAALDRKVCETAAPRVKEALIQRAKACQIVLQAAKIKNPDHRARLIADMKTAAIISKDGKLSSIKLERYTKVFNVLLENIRSLKQRKMTVAEFQEKRSDFQGLVELASKRLGNPEVVKKLNQLPDKTFAGLLKNEEARKYIRTQINKVNKSFKAFQAIFSMMVALITLPFACGFLNWAHPRVMEIIMPNASKKRSDKLKELYVVPTPLPATEVSK